MTCLKRLNDNLGVTLSNVAALEAKVRFYSWNLKGPNAYSATQMLKAHYRDLNNAFDSVVTSVFQNGYEHCYAGFKHMAGMTHLEDGDVEQPLDGILADLLDSYSITLVWVEKAHHLAQQQGNHSVANLMVETMTTFKEHMWQLRSSKG